MYRIERESVLTTLNVTYLYGSFSKSNCIGVVPVLERSILLYVAS